MSTQLIFKQIIQFPAIPIYFFLKIQHNTHLSPLYLFYSLYNSVSMHIILSLNNLIIMISQIIYKPVSLIETNPIKYSTL